MILNLRVTPAQKARWQELARAEGLSLSEWIRQRCDQDLELDIAQFSTALNKVTKVDKRKKSECPRAQHHRPGSFCKSCGTWIAT